MGAHPHRYIWKFALTAFVGAGVAGVGGVGGLGLTEVTRAPFLALLGAAAYAVSLLPSGRSDPRGWLADYAASASAVLALMGSAANWLVSTPGAPQWALWAALALLILIVLGVALMPLLPEARSVSEVGEERVADEEEDREGDGGDHGGAD